MKTLLPILLFFFSLSFSQKDMSNLSDHLKPFQSYIGKSFSGNFTNSRVSNFVYGDCSFKRVLNGAAVYMVESINKGDYIIESMIMWDPEKEFLRSWHFTSAGKIIQKKVEIENEKIIFIEDVSKNRNGITKIKTSFRFLNNGSLHSKIKYFMNNLWVDGNDIFYEEKLGQ